MIKASSIMLAGNLGQFIDTVTHSVKGHGKFDIGSIFVGGQE